MMTNKNTLSYNYWLKRLDTIIVLKNKNSFSLPKQDLPKMTGSTSATNIRL